MAETDPSLAKWMVLEIQVELDREYEYEELAKEVATRIENIGMGDVGTHGVYSVEAVRLGPVKAAFRMRIREAKWFGNPTDLQKIRNLLFGTLANIAKDVAEIDHIQSMRKLLLVKPSSTGM